MKTVYAYVVADILHPGHVRFLRAARQLGGLLIVGVLTARATLEKKPMPIMSCTHRMELIRALQCVDSVTEQYEYSPLENIRRLCPDILIESEGHAEQPANDFVRSYGGVNMDLYNIMVGALDEIQGQVQEGNGHSRGAQTQGLCGMQNYGQD